MISRLTLLLECLLMAISARPVYFARVFDPMSALWNIGAPPSVAESRNHPTFVFFFWYRDGRCLLGGIIGGSCERSADSPALVTKSMIGSVSWVPRCAIRESRGGNSANARLIGDCRAAGINDITSLVGADIPGDLDAFLAMVSYYRKIAPDVETRSPPLCFWRD